LEQRGKALKASSEISLGDASSSSYYASSKLVCDCPKSRLVFVVELGSYGIPIGRGLFVTIALLKLGFRLALS
jgi:hypothetical protein